MKRFAVFCVLFIFMYMGSFAVIYRCKGHAVFELPGNKPIKCPQCDKTMQMIQTSDDSDVQEMPAAQQDVVTADDGTGEIPECKKCGILLKGHFCNGCGNSKELVTPSIRRCFNYRCDEQMRGDVKFCGKCGTEQGIWPFHGKKPGSYDFVRPTHYVNKCLQNPQDIIDFFKKQMDPATAKEFKVWYGSSLGSDKQNSLIVDQHGRVRLDVCEKKFVSAKAVLHIMPTDKVYSLNYYTERKNVKTKDLPPDCQKSVQLIVGLANGHFAPMEMAKMLETQELERSKIMSNEGANWDQVMESHRKGQCDGLTSYENTKRLTLTSEEGRAIGELANGYLAPIEIAEMLKTQELERSGIMSEEGENWDQVMESLYLHHKQQRKVLSEDEIAKRLTLTSEEGTTRNAIGETETSERGKRSDFLPAGQLSHNAPTVPGDSEMKVIGDASAREPKQSTPALASKQSTPVQRKGYSSRGRIPWA